MSSAGFRASSASADVGTLVVSAAAKDGFRASTGVVGADSLAFFSKAASRFFSAVRMNTLTVVRSDLLGLQSSAESGECSQMGHADGRLEWPDSVSIWSLR